AVLVLEHVDWQAAVAALCRLAARVFVVIQEDPPDLEARPLPGTMQALRETSPRLVGRAELANAFASHGFRVGAVSAREVADGKKMVGIQFVREDSVKIA